MRTAGKMKIYLLDLIVLTLIFTVLYHGFLFGGKMYAYADIGADTINQYLPVTVHELESLEAGAGGGYDLQFGLGKYCDGYLLKYLNPANLALLIFGTENLHIGLLAALYFKYAAICLVSLLFFTRLLKNEKAAAVCALLWTFSGYAVLWGQHYQFLSSLLAFTVALYGFQLFLEGGRKQLWVVPAMAYLALTSYYHLYVACFFFLAYGVLYLAFSGKSVVQILKKAGIFVLAMIPALCMAAGNLLPAAAEFLDSSRVAQVTGSTAGSSLFYSPAVILSFAARFLSSDLIGTGNDFQGPFNYYECAILSVSLLFVFAFVYLLQRKYWKRVLGITAVCVILLCMPLTSRVMVFAADNQRWTYLLCMAQVIAIGFALTDILQHREEEGFRKLALRTVVISDILLALAAAVLIWQDRRLGGNWLSFTACATVVVTAALYHCAFGLMYKTKRVFPTLLAAVVLELVLCNYAAVNDRQTITVEQWYNGMYNDGTEQVVSWIREQDDSVYRINKTYQSAYYTDSLVQGYNGMGAYSSTNSDELVALARSYGYSNARNWLGFDGTDLLANSMLGVKYVIAKSGEEMNPAYFSPVYDDGSYAVYENPYWLGFGWLYREQTAQPVRCGTTLEKAMQLSEYYYVTDLTEDTAGLAPAGTEKLDLLPYLSECYQCEGVVENGTLRLSGTGGDMLLYFDLPEIEADWLVSGVQVEMTTQTDSVIRLFIATETFDFTVDHYDEIRYESGSGIYCLDNTLPDQITRLRLDVSETAQDITITSARLILADGRQLQSNLEQLQKNCDITQEGSTFLASVDNPEDAPAMLCVPLIYSDRWKATIDGQAVQTVNINGGLLGVPVEPGTHRLCLEYQNSTYTFGAVISIVSAVAYAGFALLMRRRKQTGESRA